MQLTASERAIITAKSAKNVTPQVIRAFLGKRRKRTNPPQKPPDVGTIQRFIRRRTHNRTKETRGRKRQITKKKFATLNAVREKLIKEAEAGKEVTLADVKKKSKVKASTSTRATGGPPPGKRLPCLGAILSLASMCHHNF